MKKHIYPSMTESQSFTCFLSSALFKPVALAVGKNCTSISREVRNHILFRKTGGYGRHYNACLLRKDCSHSTLCPSCLSSNRKRCSFCDKCNANCPDFQQESCEQALNASLCLQRLPGQALLHPGKTSLFR